MDQLLPEYPEDCRIAPDGRGPTVIDYASEGGGYELHGLPLPATKQESVHFTIDPRLEENAMTYLLGKRKDDLLTPEEEERRRIRRERNKVAASKCRNKRKEHIRHLMKESEDLELRNNSLQNEISTLQSEIKQLESMLDSHRCSMSCKVSVAN